MSVMSHLSRTDDGLVMVSSVNVLLNNGLCQCHCCYSDSTKISYCLCIFVMADGGVSASDTSFQCHHYKCIDLQGLTPVEIWLIDFIFSDKHQIFFSQIHTMYQQCHQMSWSSPAEHVFGHVEHAFNHAEHVFC